MCENADGEHGLDESMWPDPEGTMEPGFSGDGARTTELELITVSTGGE